MMDPSVLLVRLPVVLIVKFPVSFIQNESTPTPESVASKSYDQDWFSITVRLIRLMMLGALVSRRIM